MSVRVSIRAGCTGMGSCARLAPGVFRMDAAGRPQVLLDDVEEHRDAVLRAARACPFIGVEIDGVPIEERFVDAPVASIRALTGDVIELRVRCRSLPFNPGQYVFLSMRDERGEFFRTYSVVEAGRGEVALCIKLLPSGRAGAVLASIAPGTVLGLSRAAGLFALMSSDQPKLFVTGGTGVAPVLPMARAAADAPKTVVFGARSESDLFYLDELRALPNTELVLVVQDPAPGWGGRRGLVTDILADTDLSTFAEIYTCGSPGMVAAVRAAATAKGFPAECIFADAFAAAPGPAVAAARPSKERLAPPAVPARPRRRAPPTSTPRRFDALVLLRQVHYVASVLVCALIMFFAATGFVANHSDWLLAQEPASVAATETRALPATVAADVVEPSAWCRALFPDASAIEPLAGEGHPGFVVRGPGDLLRRCEIDIDKRHAVVQPLHRLDAALAAADDRMIIAALLARHGGELNEKSIESADGALAFEAESVWRLDAYQVDRSHAVYAMNRTSEPLVKAVSDLHRGKHAGVIQRLIMDVAALALLIVAISGTVMGLQVVRRRRSALTLIALSVASLAYLLLHR